MTLIVGAGPAGIMAAISSSENDDVILIERNNSIGNKLKLTGGGRCNITNNRDIEEFFPKIVNNSKFLYSALYTFSNSKLLEFLDECNLEYKEELDKKVYVKSDRADEIIDIFREELNKRKVKIMYNSKVIDFIIEDDIIKGVILENGQKLLGDKVIVATGGKSYPNTGSDGFMFDVLKKYNHTITEIYPALIPLVVKEEFVKALKGISLKNVKVYTKIKNKKIELFGDMIFTHFGISGPAVLKFSSYITKALKNNEIEIYIDCLNNISKDELIKIIKTNLNKTVINNLKGVLPQNFLKEIFSMLNLTEVKASDLKKDDLNIIISYLKEMKLTINDTLTIKSAQVTSGGIKIKEVNPGNMQSKMIKNLYFAGEILDVDGETGGYNLQIAFSTGYLSGINT